MSAQLEAERKEYESQLELVIVSLKDDPDNTELLALKAELDQMIQMIDESLAELNPPKAAAPKAAAAPPPPATTAAPAEQPKWSRENHPAFKKGAAAAPVPAEEEKGEAAVAYQVNDTVMAKWVSGDKGFYPARIMSITGSATAPMYTVRFKSYDTVETLRAKDIRPNTAAQKRKADGTVVGSAGPAPASAVPGRPEGVGNGIVLSGGPELYPQAKKEKEDKLDDKGRPKYKKIKANKELEAGKNKWQEFNAKGKLGKGAKKDSMFRTPEGVKGRVGFTGSGQAMRKDPTRSRHVYQPNEDLD
ncbi:hypothetical protein OQA88_9656 [Cercophora sp. LCS_1]